MPPDLAPAWDPPERASSLASPEQAGSMATTPGGRGFTSVASPHAAGSGPTSPLSRKGRGVRRSRGCASPGRLDRGSALLYGGTTPWVTPRPFPWRQDRQNPPVLTGSPPPPRAAFPCSLDA